MEMRFRTILARTFAVLALAGLIGAPLVAPMPAAAAPSGMSTSAMADDMPCCPPETPSTPDCYKGCPLLTVCMAKCLHNLAGLGSRLASPGLATVILPRDEAMPAGLAQAPPARPPRPLS